MTRAEFHALRDSPDKRIDADIIWKRDTSNKTNFTFSKILIWNEHGWKIWLYGLYKPSVPTVIFNFVEESVGPICRLCVNGQHHADKGRTHKHELRDPSDQFAHNNLPTAVSRPDFGSGEMSPRDVWNKLLTEAKIVHIGIFNDPV